MVALNVEHFYTNNKEEKMKSIFTSKTFWVNLLALIGIVIQGLTGSEVLVNLETQAIILSVINILLRTVTKDPVTWS